MNSVERVNQISHMHDNKYLSDIKARAEVDEKVYGISLLEQWLIDGNLSIDESVINAISFLGAGTNTVSIIQELKSFKSSLFLYRLQTLHQLLKFKRRHTRH